MSILDVFVNEYKNAYLVSHDENDTGLVAEIKKINSLLLDDKFAPSIQLKSILHKQIRKARYPMEVAITGQFSSGKSTFLNALLSKDILPTGITPVTSKVNFINYGDEYKLKITYYSGASEYAPIEEISKFTDQRKNDIKNIKYLTLYAPMPILKNISFVDTPGLNSQSQDDTETTRAILRDVGGIIWLTLIDNAGKQSEAEILEEYMEKFKDKSLCVLNQKDKFTEEQIQTTTKYVSSKFEKYFVQVTPISAKMALESRSNQKSVLIKQEQDKFIGKLKESMNCDGFDDIINNNYKIYENKIYNINNQDTSNTKKLLEESNINEILDFIDNTLRPQANKSKEYAIKNDLKSICDILIKEYETIIEVYNSLRTILLDSQETILQNFDNIKEIYSLELNDILVSLELILENTSTIVFKNIKQTKDIMYKQNNSFINKGSFNRVEYESYYIDITSIYKELFYDDEYALKQVKKLNKKFNNIQNSIENSYKNIFIDIKNNIKKWQEPYELIKKHREVSSDIEFSHTRHFAAKVYENVTRHFNISILESIGMLKEQISHFNSSISSSYVKNIQNGVHHLDVQINESIELYKEDNIKFTIFTPNEQEILKTLKSNFDFENKESFLKSRTNFLYKIIKNSKHNYLEINKDRLEFIDIHKNLYIDKVNELKEIKNSI